MISILHLGLFIVLQIATELTKVLLHLGDKYSTPGLFIVLQIATELTKVLLHLGDKYSTPGFIYCITDSYRID
jgi:hypothetical protein